MATKTAKPAPVALLEKLAKEHLRVETLETRRSGQDFQEVAVWQVKAALEAAYLAGQASK